MKMVYRNNLVDTNVLIDMINKNKYERVFVCEISIYEMLKNKTREKQIVTFLGLDIFFKKSYSELIIQQSCNHTNLFDNRFWIQRFEETLNVIQEYAFIVGTRFLDFCSLIIQILFLQKEKEILLDDETIHLFEKINTAISLTFSRMSKELKKEITELILTNSSIELEKNLYLKAVNICVEKIKQYSNSKFSLNEIANFSYDQLVRRNNIKVEKALIDFMTGEVLSVKRNPIITKELYNIYLTDALIKGGKIELNDMADIEIFFAAYSNRMKLRTNEKRLKRLVAKYLF